MTWLLNPSKLRRLYDSELALPADSDAMTLPELLDTVSAEVWKEVGYGGSKGRAAPASFSNAKAFSARRPAISSLRRNLQREHLERMIDLSLEKGNSASTRSIALLARSTLVDLGRVLDQAEVDDLDAYTRAHLADARTRIEKALDASYTRNPAAGGDSHGQVFFFGRER